ncbi:GAF and ANTAR domain-containing protein [Modestobacter versicolor]|uniref:Antitermination regulator n=1 Tax=Modestobacter versicolor TaxID=429133 RepID=A0A323V986_9ACTN|nr:GAF and ANTAR domain-containing protein [Modestobacter versicolor]MBB3676066.1 GAF domain-containing protein [Modestobacter versicolor]PZA21407.1 antitermination regulator [Modestobacter versicolor]
MSSSDPFPSREAVEALERLGRLSLADQSVESVLQTVVDLAKQVLPGGPEASISMVVNGRPSTPSSTAQLALELDESQYTRGYGPCLTAASSGAEVEIADTSTETRWADYCRVAAERGNGSSLSVPLSVEGRVVGALNLYATEAHAFDDAARATARRFAPYAAVAASNVYAYQHARDLADNLRVALESRALIDQAKGILMERHRLDADEAFRALASVSMRTNTKVRDVAEELIATGAIDLGAAGLA